MKKQILPVKNRISFWFFLKISNGDSISWISPWTLFCKFLDEKSNFVKNKIHHDLANKKSYKTVISNFFFLTSSQTYLDLKFTISYDFEL